jgi:hypothetical protein
MDDFIHATGNVMKIVQFSRGKERAPRREAITWFEIEMLNSV